MSGRAPSDSGAFVGLGSAQAARADPARNRVRSCQHESERRETTAAAGEAAAAGASASAGAALVAAKAATQTEQEG